jgi:hypothetical protein
MNQLINSGKTDVDFTIFTVCNLAYLPKALVLAESVRKYQDRKLKIFLFDKKSDVDLSTFDIEVIWVEDLSIPDFNQLAFKYDIIEFSTSLKPFITLNLLKQYNKVIFLDPDTCLFNDVGSIVDELDHHSIILTPHYTTPQSNDLSESDTGMLRFGSFNLGFYAVRNSSEGLYFLNWWSQRCFDLCYMDSQFGLSTDQKWVTIAPCFFKDLYVSFYLGYNFAAWNSWERKLSKNSDGNYLVNDDVRLVFFHFSNFDQSDPEYLNKRSKYEIGMRRPDLLEIGTWYSNALDSKRSNLADTKYAYDYMSNGDYISPTLRRAYACILPELPENHNPFDSEGVVAKFAKKNYLFERNNVPYKREGFGKLSSNQGKLSLIYFLMRILLRIVGPNKFMNLSRLMVYVSSYRLNRGLWKY